MIVLIPWMIWNKRNNRVFNNNTMSARHLFNLIIDEATTWSLAGYRHILDARLPGSTLCRIIYVTTSTVQNIDLLTFFNPKFDRLSYSKFVHNINFLLWLALVIKGLQEWLKFDYVCTNVLHKTSGRT
ncbi:hypothetical protein HU200_029423 [Digitaria exilis]|uniref:Uncharacterized protein n=1 Tax=Digitaria exilis TaxID=1010633 RepID=A0A835C2A0_9POAL|nr:hypothetical protein HU200_029423 [Digitaria exilis]